MNLLPSSIRRRFVGRLSLLRIVDNISWLFLDKILRTGLGLLVSVWLARYLGPEQFGQFNYAIAFVALFGGIASLGLNGIVVRDLVVDPKKANATLGTAFILRVFGGLIATGIIIFTILWFRPNDELGKAMIAILSFRLMFQSSAVIKWWFESQVQSRYVVWIENSVLLFVSAIKIAMILGKAPLIFFAWALLIEAILTAIGLFALYVLQVKALKQWKVSLDRAKALLRDSWPLIFSGLAIMVYMRIDQIMLGEIVGKEAVGIYSAGLRISEVWYTIPMIIAASFFPTIIKSKKESEALYRERMQNLLNLLVTIALVIALVITFTAKWMIMLLFGQNYVEAIPVLMTHIWAGIFVFIGVAGGKWYLTENLQKFYMYRTAFGAIINIILNLILIPLNGATGAALATLISHAFSDFVFDALSTKTSRLFNLKTRAILFGAFVVFRKIKKHGS